MSLQQRLTEQIVHALKVREFSEEEERAQRRIISKLESTVNAAITTAIRDMQRVMRDGWGFRGPGFKHEAYTVLANLLRSKLR